MVLDKMIIFMVRCYVRCLKFIGKEDTALLDGVTVLSILSALSDKTCSIDVLICLAQCFSSFSFLWAPIISRPHLSTYLLNFNDFFAV